jgi:hypothetical protein
MQKFLCKEKKKKAVDRGCVPCDSQQKRRQFAASKYTTSLNTLQLAALARILQLFVLIPDDICVAAQFDRRQKCVSEATLPTVGTSLGAQ